MSHRAAELSDSTPSCYLLVNAHIVRPRWAFLQQHTGRVRSSRDKGPHASALNVCTDGIDMTIVCIELFCIYQRAAGESASCARDPLSKRACFLARP